MNASPIVDKIYSGVHFATFLEKLIEPCALAVCPEGGIILDSFIGSGITAVVALKQNKHFIGIDLNPKYIEIAKKKINNKFNKLTN